MSQFNKKVKSIVEQMEIGLTEKVTLFFSNKDIKEILFTEEQIRNRCDELAKQIDQDYAGQEILLVGLLKGSIPFMAELAKHLQSDVKFDFMSVSSYDGVHSKTLVVRQDLKEDVSATLEKTKEERDSANDATSLESLLEESMEDLPNNDNESKVTSENPTIEVIDKKDSDPTNNETNKSKSKSTKACKNTKNSKKTVDEQGNKCYDT